MPRVSIIVPLYNKTAYVRDMLDSVSAQTYSDFELIVVDDGSTDGGGDVVMAYDDRRFRLIRQSNVGPGRARNAGIKVATGELLAFLDADDEWLPDYLAAQIGRLDSMSSHVATVTCGYLEYPGGNSRESMWRRRGIREGAHSLTARTPSLLAVHMLAYMAPWSTVARAEVVRSFGGFYDRGRCLYGEDSFLWLKVILNWSFALTLQPLVRYRRDRSALSHNLQGPRPVEPLLTDVEEIEAVCPQQLQALLRDIIAIRAQSTAFILGSWGARREAAALRKRFIRGARSRLPGYAGALLFSTPIGVPLVPVFVCGRRVKRFLRTWRAKRAALTRA